MARSYTFTHTISRKPGRSVSGGLRAEDKGGDPSPEAFGAEHEAYMAALQRAGCETLLLEADEAFPDSVFIEDAALCLGSTAIVLRPGAPSRFGEAQALKPTLEEMFTQVIELPGKGMEDGGLIDGGDILITSTEVLVGLSDRTDAQGFEALSRVVSELGYTARPVHTPKGVLHFKSDCGLLDEETMFSTKALADSGCFEGYQVIETPPGEEAAANLIRVNDKVFLSKGFPKTQELVTAKGFELEVLPTYEAAKVDGGLSCMSLRFNLDETT